MPGKVKKFLKKAGIITSGVVFVSDLSSGKSFAESAIDFLDPFSPDEIYNEDLDQDGNGILDWQDEINTVDEESSSEEVCSEQ